MIDIVEAINRFFGLNLGHNKSNELKRLVYEIYRRDGCSSDNLLNSLIEHIKENKIEKGQIFSFSKNYLLEKRFPRLSSKKEGFLPYLNKLDIPEHKQRLDYGKGIKPENVFIVRDVEKSNFTQSFLKRLPSDVNIQIIPSLKDYMRDHKINEFKLRKRDVFVTKENYDFFKPCPCAKFHVRCGYHIMNLAFGCPLDCSYCYLQQYSNFPGVVLKTNLDEYFKRFESLYKSKQLKPFRLGTGEFADSLAFDKYTHYSKDLVNFFKDKDILFELKTKTDDIDLLLGLEHNRKTVISWSLNPVNIIQKEELYAADLEERLLAAKKCQEAGYRIAFHFDPIIYYENWRRDYKNLIKQLFSVINSPLSWISLGTLRFNAKLKSIIEHRFPESNIVYGELIVAEDKKLRYPKFLRSEIYKDMINWIREYDKEVGIYLCMESRDVWQDVIMKVDADVENYVVYQAIRK